MVRNGQTNSGRMRCVLHRPTVGTRKQAADDLGVGMSTLTKWMPVHRDINVVSKEDLSLTQENEPLRRGECVLKCLTSALMGPYRAV